MSKGAFFRQSGWMVVATTVSGLFMYAVHIAAAKMPKAEYGVFATLLQVLNQMTIPAVGLQLSFAQIAVAALAENRPARLRGALRAVAWGSFVLWIVICLPMVAFQDQIVANYKISNPVALWVTLLLGLASLWSPMIYGTLQGMQDFQWFGWAYILNGFARLMLIGLVVLVLGGYAAGAITGALLGMVLAITIGVWRTWEYWHGATEPFEWLPWVRRLLPLTLGFGTVIYMMSLDMIVVQRFFPREETGFYGAAGMIGRAIYFFTAPMAAVMFPKVVQSAAQSEKSNVLLLALGVTALMGAGAALGCTLFPKLPLWIVFDATYLKVAPLVPVFAWCMLPLTLSSVLINNLLARERYAVVPWLIAVAVFYSLTLNGVAARSAAALWILNPWLDQMMTRPSVALDFTPIVQTLGVSNFLMLAICLFFTWRAWMHPRTSSPAPVGISSAST